MHSDVWIQSYSWVLQSRSPGYRALHEGIRVLYSIWASFIWIAPHRWSPKDHTLSNIYNKTRFRCRRVLEHLFRVQSTEVFECIVDCWNRANSVRYGSILPNTSDPMIASSFFSRFGFRTSRHSLSKCSECSSYNLREHLRSHLGLN